MTGIPTGLTERRQWVVWRTEYRRDKHGNRKATKVPYRPNEPGRRADSTDPATWSTYEQAVAAAERFDGIGYVFSDADPYTGVDLDACIDPDTGDMHADAAVIVAELGGYTETSPSGTGVHILVEAELHGDRNRTSKTPWGGVFEVYDRGRFFTVTGNGSGTLGPRPEQLDALVDRMFSPASSNGRHAGRSAEELLNQFPKLGQIARRQGKPPKDASDSGWDFYLACEGCRCGLSDGELEALIRYARRGDPKGDRTDYARGTIANARRETAADERAQPADPTTRISARWGITGDPIVGGELIGDVASGEAIAVLRCRSGRRLRFDTVGDLFEPRRATRMVSTVVRSRFDPLTSAEAVAIAQDIIALCGGRDDDPREEARAWVGEFAACAGAVIDAVGADGQPRDRWAVLHEYELVERELPRSSDVARRSVILRKGEEVWLPAGALKEYVGSRMSWPRFRSRLAEIGWHHEEIDVRAPTTREAKATAARIHRRFYVGAI